MIDTNDIQQTLQFLINNADPEGENHKKLSQLLDKVERNVFLGPRSRIYIQECISKFDNIECVSMTRGGRCRAKKGKACEYKKKFSHCNLYEPAKAELQGNSIKLGGN